MPCPSLDHVCPSQRLIIPKRERNRKKKTRNPHLNPTSFSKRDMVQERKSAVLLHASNQIRKTPSAKLISNRGHFRCPPDVCKTVNVRLNMHHLFGLPSRNCPLTTREDRAGLVGVLLEEGCATERVSVDPISPVGVCDAAGPRCRFQKEAEASAALSETTPFPLEFSLSSSVLPDVVIGFLRAEPKPPNSGMSTVSGLLAWLLCVGMLAGSRSSDVGGTLLVIDAIISDAADPGRARGLGAGIGAGGSSARSDSCAGSGREVDISGRVPLPRFLGPFRPALSHVLQGSAFGRRLAEAAHLCRTLRPRRCIGRAGRRRTPREHTSKRRVETRREFALLGWSVLCRVWQTRLFGERLKFGLSLNGQACLLPRFHVWFRSHAHLSHGRLGCFTIRMFVQIVSCAVGIRSSKKFPSHQCLRLAWRDRRIAILPLVRLSREISALLLGFSNLFLLGQQGVLQFIASCCLDRAVSLGKL